MALPDAQRALIPDEKITRYLLSLSHLVGGAKAKFFRAHGYSEANVEVLAEALRQIAATGERVEHEDSSIRDKARRRRRYT